MEDGAPGKFVVAVAEEERVAHGRPRGDPGADGREEPVDPLGGDGVEVGRVGGLEGGPSAELRRGAVAETVEGDDEGLHGGP